MRNITIAAFLCFLLGIISGYFLFKRECPEIKTISVKENIKLNYKSIEKSKEVVVKITEDIKKVKLKSTDSLNREIKRVQTLDTGCKDLIGELYDQNKKRDTVIGYQKIQIDTLMNICDQYKLKTDTLQKSNDSLVIDVNTNYNIAENNRIEKDKIKSENKVLKKIIVIGGIVLGTIIGILL